MQLLKYKFRRSVFRQFQDWYRVNINRFRLKPHLIACRAKELTLGISPIPDRFMTITLTRPPGRGAPLDASVWFWDKGESIDSLGWFEAKPRRSGSSCVCEYCLELSPVTHFPNQQALWDEHIFESILQWINEVLAASSRIEFFRQNGASWVRLVANQDCLETESAPFLIITLPPQANF